MADLIQQSQFAAVRGSEIFRRENFVDRTAGDKAQVQQNDFVKVFGDRLQIVMHDQRCFARLLEIPQHVNDGAFGGSINSGKRFVHQVQIGFLGERACQKHPLLLPA